MPPHNDKKRDDTSVVALMEYPMNGRVSEGP